MRSTVLQVLTQAIKLKRGVAIQYHDQRHTRVVEPHALYSSDRGELVLDGYQTRGYSASGRPPPFWRPFRLKKIHAASMLEEGFAPRTMEGFSPTRLKYKNGLIAIVEDGRPAFAYPTRSGKTAEMGPHLPPGMRR
jgi:predicted DNA-binding transcriptional regulator YafY